MCGIVGYVGRRQARDLLLAGLQKLEYRGYDSAGISVVTGDSLESVRAVGNLANLQAAVAEQRFDVGTSTTATVEEEASTGVGHTRWATHGRVTERNAHPHTDTSDRVHVVVNGIVENYLTLKSQLMDQGSVFSSDTDAEVIAHLVAHHMALGTLEEAVRAAYAELEGHYAFVAMSLDDPDVLVGARKECPLVIGRGDGEQFIASAIPAFLAETRRVQIIENGEIVVVRPEGVAFMTPEGDPIEREVTEVDWDEETAEKAGYDTYMLNEIHEQPDAVA
jgi:glucosamine--fructose-6-phosphate aminotransferase (isomerizing)